MKIITIVGARPQFIKAAPLSRKIRLHCREILVHTGQHYDNKMSDIFFKQLNIPEPDYNLNVGSSSHGRQVGEMLTRIEEILNLENPDLVIVYGDTNSTLAGALAASKMHIKVAHIEAGLRSFNKRMPEEQNRVITDHISDYLFCPTKTAVANLKKENIKNNVVNVGDIMYDSVLYNIILSVNKFERKSISEILGFECNNISANNYMRSFYLATIHREENTGDINILKTVLNAFNNLDYPVIFPVHPRIRGIINEITCGSIFHNVIMTEPQGYLEMLYLIKNARKVLTDSGGMQKEAYFLGTPCVTLREETEWVETLEYNWNTLCRIDYSEIIQKSTGSFDASVNTRDESCFGDGNSSDKIIEYLLE